MNQICKPKERKMKEAAVMLRVLVLVSTEHADKNSTDCLHEKSNKVM